ncbi:MAG: NAD(P)H-dependent oxidoreductase [Opitutus sp.]|nr:NAD(P)H-dependent oxidoreductase [Opitutus sp.]MCS6248299.1 NAD(P)H-dependent oxidoreductase [Opitutus sp.]MCS6274998.1 NAD(P)H-dependent oxidoreductase [Opitutus sp.]MCS6278031.1 NAD(P)H-dependent oxidoreductase [Opitutus sp.]MCS6298861.1 NAD(P)H-dependent oxidoreductase [Opitutus sp.]
MNAPESLRRPQILLLNASLAGDFGNTAAALDHMAALLAPHARVARHTLATEPGFAACCEALAAADAVVIGTGTHWDSWSSHLQRFLEEATPAEGTALWLGKPVACFVTEHSVGGKGVLSRLQGVLVTLGGLIPPMSGVVLSLAAQTAAQSDPASATDASQDFWCADDLAVVSHNLLAATAQLRLAPPNWQTWPVDRTGFDQRWIRV